MFNVKEWLEMAGFDVSKPILIDFVKMTDCKAKRLVNAVETESEIIVTIGI